MRLKIGARILSGYIAALLVFVVVGGVTYNAVRSLDAANSLVAHTFQVRSTLSEVMGAMLNAETGQRGFLLTGEERFLSPYQQGSRDVAQFVQELRDLVRDSPRQLNRVNELQAIASARLSILQELIDARRAPDFKVISVAALDRGREGMENLRLKVAEIDNEESRLLEERQTAAAESSTFANYSIVLGTIIAAVIVFLLSIVIQRSITGPLAAFMAFAQRVGEGDLTQRANVASEDELGTLAEHLDRMAGSLKDVARQSTTVAENLNAATSEILASTQQQAASTAEQAAAVQQAGVTMTELSQSGAQISERAKQVATAAELVSSASISGIQSVQRTNQALDGIREQAEAVAENVISLSEKTQAIGEIIASVNDISEQSHLLALNASIQAAAAGEHGRSFAVVASEMRSLATQSKQATVQVRAILSDIQKGINTSVMLTEEAVKRTEAGKQQADTADKTIRNLSENLEESIRAFQQIVAASGQQQIGFEQLTQAFRNIGVAAHETATSTKQSEKAASNLSDLSQQLKENVRRYRV